MQIGIDLGSRAIKMAVFRDGELIGKEVVESSFEPHKQAAEMVFHSRACDPAAHR